MFDVSFAKNAFHTVSSVIFLGGLWRRFSGDRVKGCQYTGGLATITHDGTHGKLCYPPKFQA